MNTVERIKSICKERKIPISKLERDLEFGNSYISGLKKGTVPDDRLRKIANYLHLSTEYLMTGKENIASDGNYPDNEAKEIAQYIYENEDLKLLFDVARSASREHLKAYYNLIRSLEKPERSEE